MTAGTPTNRIAVWTVLLAVIALIAGAASARAGSGGTGSGGGGGGGRCAGADFGKRTLKLGDCGNDVATLNWMLKSERLGAPLNEEFDNPTDDSVRTFQHKHDMHSDGVVDDNVAKALKRSLRKSTASWYDMPGSRTACGQTIHRRTLGVAHRSLPCGTKVVIGYKHHWVRTKVIDRGPYVKSHYTRDWDLTRKTARKLGFDGVDKIRVGVLNK